MFKRWRQYRERLQHQHGWEVELTCPVCGVVTPVYNGWTSSHAIHLGNTPTIFANLNCPQCVADLHEAAGKKLVELFADIAVTPFNRRLIVWFVGLCAGGIPLFLGAGTFLGSLGQGATFLGVVYYGLLVMWFNGQVASIRYRCVCGNPTYKFMGMLGRSYCYRCSSCGKLLRLQD